MGILKNSVQKLEEMLTNEIRHLKRQDELTRVFTSANSLAMELVMEIDVWMSEIGDENVALDEEGRLAEMEYHLRSVVSELSPKEKPNDSCQKFSNITSPKDEIPF